jgi:translation initiation factor eIF-2B subunit delta
MEVTPSGSGQPGSSSNAPANGPNPTNAPPKSQKSMTKAERRELQERQRAEKAAKAAEKPGPTASKANAKQAGPSTPKKSGKGGAEVAASRGSVQPGASKGLRDLKEGATTHDDLARRTHGLRIFSHFGLTKSVSGKGDIHPVVVRLALLFSSFKISGANARCMATLTAFKTVSRSSDLVAGACSHDFPGYSRLCYSAKSDIITASHDPPFTANLAPCLC